MNYKKCLQDATLLANEASQELSTIKQLYYLSLENKEIDSRLLIRIKCTLEHLRSSLDYVAQGLSLKYSPNNKKNIYFPYASLKTDKETFCNNKIIEKMFPGLSETRPDIVEIIMAMQHFSHAGAKWFPEFMELNNKNKHVHLIPHGIRKGVSLEFNGKTIFAESIKLGSSGSIETDLGVLKGPVTITPDNVSKFHGYGIFTAESWEGIFIEGYGYPLNSYEFIKHCVTALTSIVKQFNNIL